MSVIKFKLDLLVYVLIANYSALHVPLLPFWYTNGQLDKRALTTLPGSSSSIN